MEQHRATAHLRRFRCLTRLSVLVLLLWTVPARAQDHPARDVLFQWGPGYEKLYVGVSYRDAIDGQIREKLGRGLPTTIVFTAALFRSGHRQPLATTAQSCKITWHVWKEVYFIEIVRPGSTRVEKTLTMNGVLRRCAEIRSPTVSKRLLVADGTQVPRGVPLYLQGKVQVNPVSPEVLGKIRLWVSRPLGTATAAPGDALFSTFTGLFLQRVGKAERELDFVTKSVLPRPPPAPPSR